MASTKKFAVLLSGCGVYDGSEIHEAILSLYAIVKSGSKYEVFAPDMDQYHVINHLTGEEMKEKRNVLVESARIARGKIRELKEFRSEDFDFLLIPGGFGSAKNLSDWAFKGPEGKVHPEVERVIQDMIKAGKPIGALCISPVLLAKVINGGEMTIGDDQATAAALEQTGARHVTTDHGEVVVDREYKIVTTPCYMLDANIAQIGEGAENIVKALLRL